jgi:hypothetical protein
MLMTYRSLMCSQKPPFQQRSNAVTIGQQIFAWFRCRLAYYFMNVSQMVQSVIPFPSVCLDHAFLFRRFLYSPLQTLRRIIRNTPKTNSPDSSAIDLSRNHHQGLSGGSPPPFSGLFTSYVGFIYFNSSTKTISAGSHHGSAKLVEPCPCCSIAAQAKDILQPQGTGSVLLTHQPPDRSKPNHQRFVCAVEYRSGDDRNLIAAVSTLVQDCTHRPSRCVPTPRTTIAFWPPQLVEIVATGFLRGKPAFEFREILRIEAVKPVIDDARRSINNQPEILAPAQAALDVLLGFGDAGVVATREPEIDDLDRFVEWLRRNENLPGADSLIRRHDNTDGQNLTGHFKQCFFGAYRFLQSEPSLTTTVLSTSLENLMPDDICDIEQEGLVSHWTSYLDGHATDRSNSYNFSILRGILPPSLGGTRLGGGGGSSTFKRMLPLVARYCSEVAL